MTEKPSPPEAHRTPRASLKRYRPGPRRRRDLTIPGQAVPVDVDRLKFRAGNLYQFTALHEGTRYRLPKISHHANMRSSAAASPRPLPTREGRGYPSRERRVDSEKALNILDPRRTG